MKALRAALMLAGALAIAAMLAAAFLALQLRARGLSARDEPSALDHRPHRAVEEQDALREELLQRCGRVGHEGSFTATAVMTRK